ncbi:M50 family metallopeptidase [Phycicoccus duodecadis]|uniref:Membrane-associated protease RseP (Regulator of RpoE activity) n=1 Tax=Phycicoccus duodecadis TaxID=173053 RepID=A0A2N3YG54_9MICO|nr:site-2 protease family protein [Phycicoccus duodecadis]PKW25831.1 membrane-associated protease RseP (regulator of RpoE activity) [Phycicoccus duodecadis]
MTTIAFVLGVLFMALGLALSIALHEVGHLVPAKRFGVKVTQYMVGFGPTVWSRRRGETEYGLKAVPLGGYIRMIGMFPPRPGDPKGTLRASSTGRFSQLVDEARTASLEEVGPDDHDRVFYRLPVWKKVVVMLGGPTMNLLIGVVLLTLLLTAHGVPTAQPGAVVASVSRCVVPATDAAATTGQCAGKPPTPAVAAGILPGDRLVSIGGTPVRDIRDVGALVRPAAGRPVDIVVERDGRRLTLRATPIRNLLAVTDDAGNPVLDADGKPRTTEAGFLGVTTRQPSAYVPQSLSAVPPYLWAGVSNTALALVHVPERMAGVWKAAFGGGERAADSPMSVVGVGRVAGEVSAGRLDALTGGSLADRFWFLVSLVASLNLMLFLFNLIPLLPLDGGHVAGALWEGTKRQWATLRGAPDPGFVDVAKALPVAYTVAFVLIGMSALLIYADLVNPIKLGG